MKSKYWSRFVADLEPYVPGEQPRMAGLVKLNTNENPYGPSPAVLAAIRAATGDDLRLYPPPDAPQLKTAIAQYYAVADDQIFVGNGSDEVLAHVFCALFQHAHAVLFPDITYSFYPVYCGLYGIDYRQIPLEEDFSISFASYPRRNGGIIFANPNAPTGCLVSLRDIETLLQNNTDSVVVVDEAYIDFGGASAITLIASYPNLLVVQTLSKSRSLAGLRLGFAVGHRDLIEALERVKNSFNSYPLDRLAIAGGVAAMADRDYFETTRQRVIASRETLRTQLLQLGFSVLPSAANFLFAAHPTHAGEELAAGLRGHGVIVRHFRQPRIAQFVRISIGTDAQNTQLIEALAALFD